MADVTDEVDGGGVEELAPAADDNGMGQITDAPDVADDDVEREFDDDMDADDIEDHEGFELDDGYEVAVASAHAGGPDEPLRPHDDRSAWYGPLESIALKPRLFALPIIVLLTLGLLAAFIQKPVYKAESQLIVGNVVQNFAPADGQVLAIQQLTDIYSRLVGSADHMQKIDDALGESVPASALTAAPIPNSALIRLEATGSSQAEAIARADAASEQLRSLVDDLRNQATASGASLLDQITTASVDAAALKSASDAATAAANAAPSNAGLQQAAAEAKAKADTAALKVSTLTTNYTTIQNNNAGGIGLSSFSTAQPTGSDRKSNLEIYGIGAVLIGALLGMALATLSANHWQLIPRAREPESAS